MIPVTDMLRHCAPNSAVAVEEARSAGVRQLPLGVHLDNARAIAFYARQGFVQAGVRRFPVGGQVFDDLVLSRALTDRSTT